MIIQKIKRRIKNAVVAFKKDIKFSKKLAFYRLLTDLFDGLRIKKLYYYFRNKKDQEILKHIDQVVRKHIFEYSHTTNIGNYFKDAPIWICWWTGESAAPRLVQKCIESIRFNANHHPVILIDKDNINKYLDVPLHLYQKIESNQLCLANFTDYLRVALIEKYGGLWLDSTIFCTKSIPEDYFQIY